MILFTLFIITATVAYTTAIRCVQNEKKQSRRFLGNMDALSDRLHAIDDALPHVVGSDEWASLTTVTSPGARDNGQVTWPKCSALSRTDLLILNELATVCATPHCAEDNCLRT